MRSRRLTPGIGLLLAYMFYVLFHDYGWEVIASAPPLDPGPKPLVNYLIAVELGVASGFSWWGGIGFLTRNTRSRRNAVYPEIIQLGFAGGAACTIGLFSALVVQTDDPTEWMVPIGGVFVGVIALVFVGLANITSTAVSIFSMVRTLDSMSPRALPSRSAATAPVPAALPADETCFRSHSGIRPSTMAYLPSICAPNAPARRMRRG